MSRPIANVNPNYDTWSVIIERTNEMAHAFTNYAVTTFPNTAGDTTTGNGTVIGNFGATNVFAISGLRGGTVTTSANLSITSNAIFNGALSLFNSNVEVVSQSTVLTSNSTLVNGTSFVVSAGTVTALNGLTTVNGVLTATSNVFVTGSSTTVTSNVSINNALTTISGGVANVVSSAVFQSTALAKSTLTIEGVTTANTFNVLGVSTFAANANPTANNVALGSTNSRWSVFATNVAAVGVTANTSQANLMTVGTTADTFVVTNANVGSNVTTAQVVMTVPRSTYRSGAFKIQMKTADSYQHSDASFVHDTNDVYMSVYGTVTSNGELGDISAVINGANLEFRVKQNRPNLAVQIVATGLK